MILRKLVIPFLFFLLNILDSFVTELSMFFCLNILNEPTEIFSNIELLNLNQKNIENCLNFFLCIIDNLAKTLKNEFRVFLKFYHVIQFIFIIELQYLSIPLKFFIGDVVIRSEVLQDLIHRILPKGLPDGLDLRVEQVFDDSNLGC